MNFKPHNYQKYAVEYIKSHPVAAILLDMGLGKTVISLTAMADLLFDSFEVHKILVIGPLRVARDSWPMEVTKWEHLKHLTYAVAIGTPAERRAALERNADITIINRENVDWLVESGYFDFDMVVIDELSSFKNHTVKRFKALMKVRPKVNRIVGLTGTPSSNGLMDLWSEFRLLDMGERLGKFITRYREAFFMPDKRNSQMVFSYKPRLDAEEEIYRRISDITISMKCTDHLNMPELISSQCEVVLSDDERKQYEKLKSELVLTLSAGEITVSNAASLTNKLSQLSNGAIYDDEKNIIEIHSRKLDALEDIIESANGNPILVAYWFKHDLERIRKRFDVREIKTSKDITDWNAGKIPVALIHPASAGHGLNLQSGGSTLVWFGLTWSLELYQQTNARLWRQGQTAGTVVIQHIIAKGTIDERVLKALSKKELTQNALIDAVKAEV
ncbi:DEAD/DEAH box helicase [Ruminobacter sp. RM87]|uniref:DEAD/DEAH box helicase n=1 Tax=Ruminobacter sp. RM87 TaxID=1200567 RepID=UPI0004E28576|nr:DEAD/DEAH box helicase [Ruminobacter sp. RM87]